MSCVGCIRYQQSREQFEPPASNKGDEYGTMIRVESKEVVGSFGLEGHTLNILGIHIKLCVLCNQRWQSELVRSFFLVNLLSYGRFLGVLFTTTGVTTSFLETTLGLIPSEDLEAIVGLYFQPDVCFL